MPFTSHPRMFLVRVRSGLIAFALAIATPAAAQDGAPSEAAAAVPESPAPATAGAERHESSRPAAAVEPPAATAALRPAPPANLDDLGAWLVYKSESQREALPLEARVFHRRGLRAWSAGDRQEAVRFVRGAAELDPSDLGPRLTLARWSLLREPAQTVLDLGELFERFQSSFVLQLGLAANALHGILHGLTFGLFAVALMVLLVHFTALRHPWQERIGRFVTPRSAVVWAALLVALPFALGLDPLLPTLFLLGLLGPHLRRNERVVFALLAATLAAAPWVTGQMSRLATPLDEGRGPYWGVLTPETVANGVEREARLAERAAAHPGEVLLQFGHAWAARDVGDWSAAEAAYRRVLERWPDDDRTLNNLGNVMALAGRTDEAIELYRRAIAANEKNAAPHYNLGQALTQRFELRAGSEETAKASALDFELVRSHKNRATSNGQLPLADQWPAPGVFWKALAASAPAAPAALPPGWSGHPIARGWPFVLPALGCAAVGLVLGRVQQKRMPLRRCANCDRIVCRRCTVRRRAMGLCRDCARAESAASEPEFSGVLLEQRRRRAQRLPRLVVSGLAVLVPGFALVARRRLLPALLFTASLGVCLAFVSGTAAPYAYEPRFVSPERPPALPVLLAPWIAIHAWAVWIHFRRPPHEKARRPAASRPAPPRPGRGGVELAGRRAEAEAA